VRKARVRAPRARTLHVPRVVLDRHEIASARVSSGGRLRVPALLHISHGLLHGGGGQHSETPLSIYWNLPGIEIVAPSGAYEVKGLLRTALKSENPTIVFTHAFLYGAEDEVPDHDYEIPFGVAEIKRAGDDVTIVACSMMVSTALAAAEQLAAHGIDADVIDLRTLVPLDEQAILDSVARTGRLVVADEGRLRCGFASETAAIVAEKAFDSLRAPVIRVARMDVPVSNNPVHEAHISPTAAKITAAATHLVHGAATA
jgi:pyruvate dehydrogenase E1 component beta subunit